MGELLNAAAVLKGADRLKKYYDGHEGTLDGYFDCLEINRRVEERISTAIISEEEMAQARSLRIYAEKSDVRATGLRKRLTE